MGPRRYGPAYTAGGGLFSVLGEMQTGGSGEASTGVDLSAIVGRSVDEAAQEIARVLAPENADADQIKSAIQEALAESLPEMQVFDPAALTEDQIILITVQFLSLVLFQQVTSDAGSAWNKSDSANRTVQAEATFLDLIRTAVDKYLSPLLVGGIGKIDRTAAGTLQRKALEDVWREWGAYE